MRRSDRLTTALVLVSVAAIASGCSAPPASTAPTPSALGAASASPTASPSAAASATAAAASPTRSFVLPSPAASPFAPDLEARLPSELRGIPLYRISAPLENLAGGGDMCIVMCSDEPGRLASAAGVDLTELDIAMAVPPDDSGLAVEMLAIRFPGLATERLIPARLEAGGHSSNRDFPPDVTVVQAGDEVVTWVQWLPFFPEAGQVEYLYARDDVLYIISGLPPEDDKAAADVALAVEAIARL